MCRRIWNVYASSVDRPFDRRHSPIYPLEGLPFIFREVVRDANQNVRPVPWRAVYRSPLTHCSSLSLLAWEDGISSSSADASISSSMAWEGER